ncbi:hypothetical protein TNCV_5012741 [Trichonephila clavipes]|nr:hypothetical protein TNCV_5012741 [Trichonephila clavipes]
MILWLSPGMALGAVDPCLKTSLSPRLCQIPGLNSLENIQSSNSLSVHYLYKISSSPHILRRDKGQTTSLGGIGGGETEIKDEKENPTPRN